MYEEIRSYSYIGWVWDFWNNSLDLAGLDCLAVHWARAYQYIIFRILVLVTENRPRGVLLYIPVFTSSCRWYIVIWRCLPDPIVLSMGAVWATVLYCNLMSHSLRKYAPPLPNFYTTLLGYLWKLPHSTLRCRKKRIRSRDCLVVVPGKREQEIVFKHK